MTKKIEYLLEYREDGERKVYQLEIDFVSHRSRKLYNKLFAATIGVQSKFDRFREKSIEIELLEKERPSGYKKDVELLRSELKKITDELAACDAEDIIQGRFDIIKRILWDNGYKEPFLHEFEFWDEKVDPNDANEFLMMCVFKDIDKKKL